MMTVRELIKKLKECDPEARVWYHYDGSIFPLEDEDVTIDQDGDVNLHE